MRTLIYSDVHGNLPAFETMLKKVGMCDYYICLGDLVNYGPWSNECVDLAVSLPNSTLLMGNHEEAFIKGSYPGENPLVKAFFDIASRGFNRNNEISLFKEYVDLESYRCIHTIRNSYIYPDTAISLDHNYIVGHSHHQFTYQNNGYTLYNSGSVGQNRNLIDVCNYLIVDIETMVFSLESIVYDLSVILNEMRSRNYPEECILYYQNKKRFSSI